MKLSELNLSISRFVPKSLWPSDHFNEKVDGVFEWLGKYYIVTILFIHFIYISLFFGFLNVSPNYIQTLNIGIQLFIGLFLIFRFHPFRTHEYKKYDSNVIFGSGIFLLTNLGFIEGFKNIITKDAETLVKTVLKQ